MTFSTNSPVLFVLVGIIIAAVLGQSVYFLVKSLRRAKSIGMDKRLLKKTVISAAIFTIASWIAYIFENLSVFKDE